eukprot:CAMPEP_0177691380 /NCGR_PEP_ID=MMETSP0484_2-20121128/1277_1 /TAXON_ID=354590 /ORGANISM="Rhodomonas lens, Strain RHODO" /LENGTH=233 /DNA_ID=CAMNT_0019202003 /DNA_START=40 /DNA_END=741 /DNA_ORIENTATION=-
MESASRGASASGGKTTMYAVGAVPVFAFLIATIILYSDLGATLFAFHPFFMVAAFVLLMPTGASWYRLGNLVAEGRGNSQDLNGLRTQHAIFQGAGALCALLGFIMIVASKISQDHPVLGWPSTHAFFGWCALLGVVLQASVGFVKRRNLVVNQEKTFRWHGQFGVVVLVLSTIAIILGAQHMLIDVKKDAAGGMVVIAVTLSSLGVVVGGRLGLAFPPGSEEIDMSSALMET